MLVKKSIHLKKHRLLGGIQYAAKIFYVPLSISPEIDRLYYLRMVCFELYTNIKPDGYPGASMTCQSKHCLIYFTSL